MPAFIHPANQWMPMACAPVATPLDARLSQLEKCKEQNLISDEEFVQIRQRLFISFATGPFTEEKPRLAGDSYPSCEAIDKPQLAKDKVSSASLDSETGELGTQSTGDSLGDWREADFWVEFVDVTFQVYSNVPMEQTENKKAIKNLTMADLQEFDLSESRLKEFFTEFDADGDGNITISELLRGLQKKMRYKNMAEDHAVKICKHVTERWTKQRWQDGRGIDLILFGVMLTRLRLAELFTPTAGAFQFCDAETTERRSRIYVCDYNRETCAPPMQLVTEESYAAEKEEYDAKAELRITCQSSEGTVEPDQEAWSYLPCDEKLFFFGQRRDLSSEFNGKVSRQSTRNNPKDERTLSFGGGPQVPTAADWLSHRDVRWVHVDATEGLDRLTLFRIAVKYRLHPLAVDDIIDNRTPTKLDIYDDQIFISLDIVSLASQSQGKNTRVRVNRSNVSIFLSNARDTLLTILQDRPDKSSWLAGWYGRGDDENIALPDGGWWQTVLEDLKHDPPRRMRERRGDYLLYMLLDRVTDQMRPIAEAYANRLGYMHQRPLRAWNPEWLTELDELHLELVDLARSIKPMKSVLHHLIKQYRRETEDTEPTNASTQLLSNLRDKNREEQMCLEDVEDAIEQMLGDLEQLKEMGRSLEEAYQEDQERQSNGILFNLSVAGVIFLPAQFITGLYGMNFVDDEGVPQMPELTMKDGYLYFWLLQLGCIILGLSTTGCVYYVNHHLGKPLRHMLLDHCCCCCKRSRHDAQTVQAKRISGKRPPGNDARSPSNVTKSRPSDGNGTHSYGTKSA